MKPPNEKGALLQAPIPKPRLRGAYVIATLFVKVLDSPFWRAEQWRGRLADHIANEEGNR